LVPNLFVEAGGPTGGIDPQTTFERRCSCSCASAETVPSISAVAGELGLIGTWRLVRFEVVIDALRTPVA
jgi:hypothetical protein